MAEERTPSKTTQTTDAAKREPPIAYQRLSLVVSILLVISAILTLLSSWEEDITTSDANYEIITTEFNRTQATLLSQAQARQNYTVYSYYLTNNLLYNGLTDAIADAETPPEDMVILQEQADWLSSNNRFFFPGRYIKPDGSYDLARNEDEVFADLGRRTSLDSTSLRAEANAGLERRLHYMMVTFVFGLATAIFGFETLFYWERRAVRFVLIAVGAGLFAFGIVNYFIMGPNPFTILRLG